VQVLYKKQNPGVDALPSTLEIWVNYQMQKINNLTDAPQQPVRPFV
jgi:hypothetical protein